MPTGGPLIAITSVSSSLVQGFLENAAPTRIPLPTTAVALAPKLGAKQLNLMASAPPPSPRLSPSPICLKQVLTPRRCLKCPVPGSFSRTLGLSTNTNRGVAGLQICCVEKIALYFSPLNFSLGSKVCGS